jgi:hypothetical protein
MVLTWVLAVIISIVGDSLRNPNTINGADAITKACWSGSFLQDDNNERFDYLGEIK